MNPTQYENLIKNQSDQKEFLSIDSLLRQIRLFDAADENEKRLYLENGPTLKNGGQRESVQKVSDETLQCMIVLILDFPNLSANSIAKYLNSKYGPNYQYAKKVLKRTVQRYLRYLRFNVKKASFAPPNRNSIGLRIYRAVWCKIIDDILDRRSSCDYM